MHEYYCAMQLKIVTQNLTENSEEMVGQIHVQLHKILKMKDKQLITYLMFGLPLCVK